MNEFEFIKNLSINFGNDIYGIGDDAVLVENNLLISKDMLIENIHFLPTTPINHIINKLFASNISDIAAMGGTAKYALLGIATDDNSKLDKILSALKHVVVRYNINASMNEHLSKPIDSDKLSNDLSETIILR